MGEQEWLKIIRERQDALDRAVDLLAHARAALDNSIADAVAAGASPRDVALVLGMTTAFVYKAIRRSRK